MTRQEKEQELLDADIKEPQLSEALAAWEKEQEQIIEDAEQDEKDGEEIITVSNAFANSLGFNALKGVGVTRMTKAEFQANQNVQDLARTQLEFLKSDEFKEANAEEVYQKGLKNYFDVDNIESYDTGSEKNYKTHREEYNSMVDYSNAANRVREAQIGQMISLKPELGGRQKLTPELRDKIISKAEELKRGFNKKFANEAEYEEYLKQKLGDKYEDYKLYQASLNEDGVYQPAEGVSKLAIDDKSRRQAELEI